MEVLYGLLATVPIWLIWPVMVGVAVYWYLTKHHNYFKKLGIPYISPIPVFGSMRKSFFDTVHNVEVQRYKEKGRIYGTYEGRKPVLNVAEPDLLRDIFVKDFQHFTRRRDLATGDSIVDKMLSVLNGEDWKRVRSIITPAFTTGKIKKMTSIFTDSAKTVAENFGRAAESGKPIECKSYFGAFTMDVIASSAFGTKIDSHNDPNNTFVLTARKVFTRNVPWRFVLLVLFPSIMKMFRISVFAPGAMAFFKKVTLQIIKERKEKNQTRNDFLQLMIDCAKEGYGEVKEKNQEKEDEESKENNTSGMGNEENDEGSFKPTYLTKSLSEDELVAQCVIFFLAGYDTTASTLSFTAYELALNPKVQEKLISEVDGVIKSKGEISYEDICQMKYLDCVISETLRKYPPAIRAERVCDTDYQLGDTDITIPKEMLVGIPIYAMHHDPHYYPDPEKYVPERFSPEEKASRHPYTYLPFGAGPRNCVGMRFALMEIKVCLVNLVKQFRFKPCSETQIPLKFYFGQGLLQPKDITLKVERRTDAVKM